jgi:predicted nucleotidyltransferase
MPLELPIDYPRMAALCQQYNVASLELFGSRARGTARADSDVDLLVTFADGRTPGLGFVTFAEELESLFSRPVDLLMRETVERDENPIRRASILRHTEPLYAA